MKITARAAATHLYRGYFLPMAARTYGTAMYHGHGLGRLPLRLADKLNAGQTEPPPHTG